MGDDPVIIHTDTTYVRNGITKWVFGWKPDRREAASEERRPLGTAAVRLRAAPGRVVLGQGVLATRGMREALDAAGLSKNE